MKRCLVTGGLGFIGSHLCERLIKEGFYVIVMDNLITGSENNVEHIKDSGQFEFIRHDVSNYIEIEGSLDYVFHFASPASPFDYLEYPIQTLKVGSRGTINTLGVAKAKGAVYMLASTSEVYGDPEIHPQVEEYFGHVNPIGPRGVYDEAKRFAESLTLAYHKQHNMDTRIVRIFNTYGPRMRPNDGRAIPNFITQALRGDDITIFGDGLQTRSFCFIDDLVEGIFRMLKVKYQLPINLGNPEEYTIAELAQRISKLCRSSSNIVCQPLPEDDPKRRKPDITKAKNLLNWQPKIELEDGLPATIKWFKRVLNIK